MEETELLSLPEEVLLLIGNFLDLKSVLNCSATCRYLRKVLNDNRLWRRFYRKDIVQYIKRSTNLVTPGFHYEECETLDPLCEERLNLLKQAYLLDNWVQGRCVSLEADTTGNELVLENNDRQIIFDHIYLFLHVLNTNEINIWNIEEVPFLYTSVKFSLYEYNMEDEDFTDIVRVWYQLVDDKLLVIQGNLVQVFRITLPDKELPLDYLISVDRDKAVDDFVDTLQYTDCYSWIIGNKLISRLCYLPVVHIWDVLTGTKVRSLRAPTVGWDLYVISTDDEDNVIFSLRTDDPFASGPEDYASIVNHVSSYRVSQNEYTTIFTELKACKPVHAMRHRTHIVLFCIDDMFIFRCSVYVYDTITSAVSAHETFNDLVGLYKSRIIGDRLVLATRTSVDILDIMSLQLLNSLKIDDIIDIDYLPVFSTTFIITSSVKNETEVWDVEKQQIVLKIPQQTYVFLNQSCSKLILLSGHNLVVRHFW